MEDRASPVTQDGTHEESKAEISMNSQSGEPAAQTNPSWDMFQIVSLLGEGTYGKVMKVKCVRSLVAP